MDDPRPVITALIGYHVEPFGVIGSPKIVPLDEAAQYHALGFAVLVDPADEAELATWERRHRPVARTWFR